MKENIRIIKPIKLNVKQGMGFEKKGFNKYPGTKDIYQALPDPKTGILVTGLEVMVSNPKYTGENSKEPKEILLRKIMEEKTGEQDLSPKSKFWEDFRVRLEDKSNVFNLDDPNQELAFYVMKASAFIRSTSSPDEMVKKPRAKYIIDDPEAEAQALEKIATMQDEARDLFKEMTPEFRRKLCRIFERSDIAHNSTSDAQVNTFLRQYIHDNPKQFLSKAKISKERFNIENEIFEGLELGVLTRNKHNQIARVLPNNVEGVMIGESIDRAVDFLERNADIRRDIRDDINARRKTAV